MGDARLLSQKALRRDQVLELDLPPLPKPPPALMKMPGVYEWWQEMELWRKREVEALNRLVNNLQINATSVAAAT